MPVVKPIKHDDYDYDHYNHDCRDDGDHPQSSTTCHQVTKFSIVANTWVVVLLLLLLPFSITIVNI